MNACVFFVVLFSENGFCLGLFKSSFDSVRGKAKREWQDSLERSWLFSPPALLQENLHNAFFFKIFYMFLWTIMRQSIPNLDFECYVFPRRYSYGIKIQMSSYILIRVTRLQFNYCGKNVRLYN